MTIRERIIHWKLIGRYRNPLYQAYLYWKDRYMVWWDRKAMDRAVNLANERCLATGKSHYVLPDENNKPRAFSSEEIDIMKRSKRMNRRVTCYDLFKESMYIAQYHKLKKK